MAKNPIGISFDWGAIVGRYELLPSVSYLSKTVLGNGYCITFQWLNWYFEVAVS